MMNLSKRLYADYVELTREIWNFFYYGLINRGGSL